MSGRQPDAIRGEYQEVGELERRRQLAEEAEKERAKAARTRTPKRKPTPPPDEGETATSEETPR